MTRRLFTTILALITFYTQASPAQLTMGLVSTTPSETNYRSGISEYFYMRSGKDILKPVKLLGVVTKPGLYHLPANTSLTSLLALSGGALPDANTKKILISRKDGTVETRDLQLAIRYGQDPQLNEGDIVVVPKQEDFMSANTATTILVVASLLTVLISGFSAIQAANND